jgi:GRIP domain
LKGSIRDLEMSLVRQREFSSTSSEDNVNVEYLVHVLRKFLLTDIASERAKLVTVLCSILHLRGEDAKVRTDPFTIY